MTSTLTTAQFARFRRTIGDHDPDSSEGYDLTNPEIQDAWDEAGGVEALTFILCLRQRLGMTINITDTASEIGANARTQKVVQIERLLTYWQGQRDQASLVTGFVTRVDGYSQDVDSGEVT